MKNLLVFAALLLAIGCQRQAKDLESHLRPEAGQNTESQGKLFEKPKNIPKYEKGVVLVKYRSEASAKRLAKNIVKHTRTKAMERAGDNGFYKIRVDDVEKEVSRLKTNSDVEWVSPNWTETVLDFQPNDPYFTQGQMYGLVNTHAQAAWNSGNLGKEDVYVVVIDEGCQYWHPDLCSKIYENPEEKNGVAGVDDDGNGYVDDVRGWNWFDGNNNIYTGNDDHGTHVAGTIAARGNSIGVIGVAPNVKIISLKFLADYGFDDAAISAIDYAIDLKQRKGLNIKIMSNSWGGGGYNAGLIEAIDRAKEADILFCAAAGNSNNNNDNDATASYPSTYPNENIIAVGASQWDNSKAFFSSYGKTTVDIFAPGVNIVSTWPVPGQHTPSYQYYSGTSMATPHISGGLALLWSVNPSWNWQQVKNYLLTNVEPVASLTQYCVSGGIMDLSKPAFMGVTSPIFQSDYCPPAPFIDNEPPTAPTNFRFFDKGIDPGGVTGYFGARYDGSTDNTGIAYYLTQLAPIGWGYAVGGTSFYATDIPFGHYEAWVVAIDYWGNGSAESNHDTITIGSGGILPDTEAPTLNGSPSASDITTSAIKVSWPAASDNKAVTAYDLYRNGTKVGSTADLFFNDHSLNSGTTYSYYYTARDAAGNVSGSSQTITATTLNPEPPPPPPPSCTVTSNLGANQNAQTVNLNWSISNPNGCVITSTRLERKKGSNSTYQTIATNPTSPYVDVVPNPGFYSYRLVVVTTVGINYSNEVTIKASKK